MENGTRKISNPHYANTYNTLYKYDSHSVVLADLLCKTKLHYSEESCICPTQRWGERIVIADHFPITHDHDVNMAPFFEDLAIMIVSDRGSHFGE